MNIFLAGSGRGDASICAAIFFVGIVKCVGRGAAFAVAAFLTLSFGIPAKFGPECVVVVGVDLSGGCVGDGELSVTLAEGTVAAVVLVAALDLAAFDAVFVLDKLTDAHVTVSPSGAFKAVFVGFANNIEFA